MLQDNHSDRISALEEQLRSLSAIVAIERERSNAYQAMLVNQQQQITFLTVRLKEMTEELEAKKAVPEKLLNEDDRQREGETPEEWVVRMSMKYREETDSDEGYDFDELDNADLGASTDNDMDRDEDPAS